MSTAAAQKPALRKPVFTKVDQLKPGTNGHTLTVKVVSATPVPVPVPGRAHPGAPAPASSRAPRIAECLVGDETGAIVFTARNEQGLHILQNKLQEIQQAHTQTDTWLYCWRTTYSSSKFYAIPYKSIVAPTPFLWIWESKCCKKLKVHMWLLFMDRLNTRNLLKRKNYKIEGDNYNCIMCNHNVKETAYHLFFECHSMSDVGIHLV